MKLFHLSDLHLGKRLMEASFLEDQAYILAQVLDRVDAERPDALILAGDIYDKAVPPAEAVTLLDDFIWRLSERGTQVFIISGNHDSPERIAFGSRLMDAGGIHLSPVYDGTLAPITLTDAHGPVHFYMLPFIKPAHVRRFFPDDAAESYTDAVRTALSAAAPDFSVRNVLITHQFITGASRSDSEELSVGGSDNVDVSVFDGFDYVALGHIHSPQHILRETVRYSGTPLKYSFSEAAQEKSITVVTLGKKGDVSVGTIPLVPRHDLRCLTGSYEALTLRANYEGTAVDDYLFITLTDEDDIPDAAAKLRVIYPNLLRLAYDNRRTRAAGITEADTEAEQLSPFELFTRFYEKQNDSPLSEEQSDLVKELIEKIWEV